MWPELIKDIGFWMPKTFGVVIMIGTCFSIWLAAKRGEQFGFDKDKIWDFGIYMVLAGILGARFVDVWVNWNNPLMDYGIGYADGKYGFWKLMLNCIAIWKGGLTFYGGFIFSSILGIWLIRKWGYNFWKFVDVIIPCMALGHAFGRVGCFLEGCCYGEVCTTGWQGVRYPASFYEKVGSFELDAVLHPTQLYESGGELFLFFFLSWLLFRKHLEGSLLFVWMIAYGLIRYTVEFWRADNANIEWMGMSLHISQYIAMAMVFIGVVGLWCLFVARSGEKLDIKPEN